MTRMIGGKTEAQLLLEIHLVETGFRFIHEYQFHADRAWRFDFLIKRPGLLDPFEAIEIEGGIFSQGRHTRGQGYLRDMEKYREAAAMGYRVYRFAPEEILKGVALDFLKRIRRDQPVTCQVRYIPKEAAIS